MRRFRFYISPNPPLAGSSEERRRSWATQPIGSIGCRCAALCGSILVVLGASVSRGDDELPKRLNFARYDTMLQRSPFALATAVARPPETPHLAKDLYVPNAAPLP